MKRALLIIGHGSRSGEAMETFSAIVRLVRESCEFEYVEGACMQLCPPSIEEQVAYLAGLGVDEIICVPHFLYEGIHIREDIPAIIAGLVKTHTTIRFKIAEPLGAAPELAHLLIRRAQGAVDCYEKTAG